MDGADCHILLQEEGPGMILLAKLFIGLLILFVLTLISFVGLCLTLRFATVLIGEINGKEKLH